MTRLLALILLASVATVSGTALAGPKHHHKEDKDRRKIANHERIRQAMLRGEIIPLQRVLAVAQKRRPGDVLEVELKVRKDGLMIYEIEMLTAQGAVRKLDVDPRTGELLADRIGK